MVEGQTVETFKWGFRRMCEKTEGEPKQTPRDGAGAGRASMKDVLAFVEQARPQSQLRTQAGFTENKETYISFWDKNTLGELC